MVTRLFKDADGSDTAEMLTDEGRSVNLLIENRIKALVDEVNKHGSSLRDAELLIVSHAQMNIARAILMRRRVVLPGYLCSYQNCMAPKGHEGPHRVSVSAKNRQPEDTVIYDECIRPECDHMGDPAPCRNCPKRVT